MKEGVTIGPLVEESAVQFVEEAIGDAIAKGATILTREKRYDSEKDTLIYEPTILTNVNSGMQIY